MLVQWSTSCAIRPTDNEILLIETHISTVSRLIIDPQNDQLLVGLIAQLVEHCTGITEVRVWVSFRPEFFRSSLHYCSSSILMTAKIINIEIVSIYSSNEISLIKTQETIVFSIKGTNSTRQITRYCPKPDLSQCHVKSMAANAEATCMFQGMAPSQSDASVSTLLTSIRKLHLTSVPRAALVKDLEARTPVVVVSQHMLTRLGLCVSIDTLFIFSINLQWSIVNLWIWLAPSLFSICW